MASAATVHKVEKKSDSQAVCGVTNRGVPTVTVFWHKVTCKNCLRRQS